MGGKDSPWAKAVSPESVARARAGDLEIVLTPVKRVPAAWLGDVCGRDVRAVWRECARVLRPGGRLLAGVINPAFFLLDPDLADGDERLEVRHPLPYREDAPETLAPGRRAEVAAGDPMEFSHSLTDLLQGQLAAGLALRDLYEDGWEDGSPQPLNAFMPTFLATLAERI